MTQDEIKMLLDIMEKPLREQENYIARLELKICRLEQDLNDLKRELKNS